MISTFEEFVNYYKKYGKCPNQLSKPLHGFNERQLLSRWESYQKAQTKKSYKQEKGTFSDSKWVQVCSSVDKRDNNQCRFLSKLKIDKPADYKYIIDTCPYNLIATLDHAHVIARSSSSNLYYEKDNIYLLSRVIHSRLDQYRNPITGQFSTKDEIMYWWKYIIGDTVYEKLLGQK